MKLKFGLLFLSFFLAFNVANYAQEMSKNDKKRWKARKKKMDLPTFKKTIEDYETLKGEAGSYKRQTRSMSKTITDKDSEIELLKQEIAKLKEEAAANPSSGEGDDTTPTDNTKGIVFKVQVGAFRNVDLMKFVNHRRFHAEEDGDGTKKYTLGTFRDYWEADLFKKYLREMGVADAWIVSYKDNQRVDIANVLAEDDIKAVQDGADKNEDVYGDQSTDDGGDDF
jgi:hypothetical protein